MNTMKLGLERIGKGVNKNLPLILSVAAGIGVGITMIITYKKSPKIHEKIENFKDAYDEVKDGTLTEKAAVVAEGAKDLAPDVLPVAIAATGTVLAIAGAQKENTKRQVALLSGLAITQADNKLLKEKIRDVVGEKKADEISGEVTQEKINRTYNEDYLIFADADPGKTTVFYDPWSDRYFRSTVEKVKAAFADYISELQNENSKSLNDLYDHLLLDNTTAGNYFGFRKDDMKYWHVDDIVRFSAGKVRGQDIPCLEMVYSPEPMRDIFGEPIFSC